MNWKEKVIKFNDKKDLESMLSLGREIEKALPRIRYDNEQQFKKDLEYRNNYIYRSILEEYKK